MANRDDKVAENVPGAFYVDCDCIACDTCGTLAPKQFVLTSDHAYAYVRLQPETEEDRLRCLDALEACPVGAIGHDG